MGSAKRKKRMFFERGVRAFQTVFRDDRELYPCPICSRCFDLAALADGRLTLEHVPPASLNGKPLCLTCCACNNRAGHTVDFAAVEFVRMETMEAAILRQQGTFKGPVRFEYGGTTINATLEAEGATVTIRVRPECNNPKGIEAQLAAFRAGLQSGQLPRMRVNARFKYSERADFVSTLRSAYLVAFALFGYRYAFHPRLNPIREQILHPDDMIIPSSASANPAMMELAPDQMTYALSSPLRGLAVHIPPRVVLLPPNYGTGDFYAALRETFVGGEAPIRGDGIGWPNGPIHWLDLKDLPASDKPG
jgi:hypothetical protein